MLDGKVGKVKLYMTRRALSNQAFPRVASPRCCGWKNLKEHRLYRLEIYRGTCTKCTK